jgi:hypothetical protein
MCAPNNHETTVKQALASIPLTPIALGAGFSGPDALAAGEIVAK